MKLRKTPLGYLTTIGAKSGAERTVPLRLFTDSPRLLARGRQPR
jgi:hypothetical protein